MLPLTMLPKEATFQQIADAGADAGVTGADAGADAATAGAGTAADADTHCCHLLFKQNKIDADANLRRCTRWR